MEFVMSMDRPLNGLERCVCVFAFDIEKEIILTKISVFAVRV